MSRGPDLELRLDEAHEPRRGAASASTGGRTSRCEMKLTSQTIAPGGSPRSAGVQRPRVAAFQRQHAGIGRELRIELSVADIDRDHRVARRAAGGRR